MRSDLYSLCVTVTILCVFRQQIFSRGLFRLLSFHDLTYSYSAGILIARVSLGTQIRCLCLISVTVCNKNIIQGIDNQFNTETF